MLAGMTMPAIRVFHGDCLKALKELPSESVDLIVTSPPYADQRAHTYGGIKPQDYVEWFLPRAEEFQRILKAEGSFVLNIKEKVVKGQRHLYVMKLAIALVETQQWRLVDDYVWHKKNCFPGKWPNRFRDAWEHCYHFTKQEKFYMDQDAVKVPVGEWAATRLRKLGGNDVKRKDAATKSGFGKNISNWVGRDFVFPSNVLHLATETSDRKHSAVFPVTLPEFFTKLFSPGDGVVCDPFLGSGTSAIAAAKLGRSFVGVELLSTNLPIIEARLAEHGHKVLLQRGDYGAL
jgi:site-specific DNA-methyltransferase (adenine-specific)